MSLMPFRHGHDDPYNHDWLISDPFRDDFFGGRRSGLGMDLAKAVSPLMSVDVVENEKDFQVRADLPGVAPEDVDLSVEGHNLVMKAERQHENEEKNDRYHRFERSYGSVQRRIQLPKNADMDNANTRFNNGVLTVTFPKLEQKAPGKRKLAINHS
jgi:HSP20 family protein